MQYNTNTTAASEFILSKLPVTGRATSPATRQRFHGGETLYKTTPILVVDDDEAIRRNLRKTLEGWGCQVEEANNGRAALALLAKTPARLVLSDIDMPEYDGFDLLDAVLQQHPETSVIMVSGMSHDTIIDEALARGAVGYVQKPFRVPELKSQVTYALRRMSSDFSQALGQTNADAITEGAREFARLFHVTSDLHHVETGAHIRRIGRLSHELALRAGMGASSAALLGEAAVLHDIGKLAIPDAILKKPGPLTPEEFEIMKTHPVLGGQILSQSKNPMLRLAHEVALHHHERWDGTGYPHGQREHECSLEARIVGIADVYDALTEKRVYKEPWPLEKVISFFQEKSGSAFDPNLVALLLDNISCFETIRLAEDHDGN